MSNDQQIEKSKANKIWFDIVFQLAGAYLTYYKKILEIVENAGGDSLKDYSKIGIEYKLNQAKNYKEYLRCENLAYNTLKSFLEVSIQGANVFIETSELSVFEENGKQVELNEKWNDLFKIAENTIISKSYTQKDIPENIKQNARHQAQKKVKAQCCLVCGAMPSRLLHRHHFDYFQPIDIFQLCIKHHCQLHSGMNGQKTWYDKIQTQKWIDSVSRIKPVLNIQNQLITI